MENKLRQLQMTQLEILKVFDNFCVRHGLKYSLYAGSLLGAVRHKGFIPWDDDLDVCMAREEYDRFLSLWNQNAPNGYILQNKDNSKYYDQSFTKIRKDHTTFLEAEWQIGNHHTGIFLDIFPVDRVPTGKLQKAVFYWNCMYYQLLTREFIPKNEHPLVKFGSHILLCITPKCIRSSIRQKLLSHITYYNRNRTLPVITTESMGALRKQYAADLLDNYIRLPFEDGEFMCFADWDDHLRRKFGDYMQLPPEEERAWRHHPIIIDFEHNYEELEH